MSHYQHNDLVGTVFQDLDKPQLKAYAAKFLRDIPFRIQVLAHAVASTPMYASWSPDLTPDSLALLGNWYRGQVAIRPRSAEEMAKLTSGLRFDMGVPDWELSDRTFSLAIDVGMYLGEIVLRIVPDTRWKQILGSKNNILFGQMAVSGTGKRPVAPAHAMVIHAYHAVDGNEVDLRRTYAGCVERTGNAR